MTRLNPLIAAGVVAMFMTLAAPAMALECPAPEPLARPGVLKETSSQIAVLSGALAAGDEKAKVQDIVAGLRAEHPDVQSAEIMNYLISAYCPVAAAARDLTDGQRQTKVDQFVLLVRSMLY